MIRNSALRAIAAGLALASSLAAQLPAGGLLVTSRNTDQVLLYDATGAFVRVFAQGGGLDNPVGLSFGPDSNLYVVSANTNAVLRFDGTSGAFLGPFTPAGALNAPRNLAFGPDGDLYVCNAGTASVLRFDGSSGAFLGVAARDPGLRTPTSFAFGPTGDLFVGNVADSRVHRFERGTGRSLGIFASQGIAGAHDVAFGPDGAMYVSNAFGFPSIVRFDGRTGAPLGAFVNDSAMTFPLGLSFGADGDLYVANQGGHSVRRYDGRSGALLAVHVVPRSGGLDAPLFCAFVPATALVVPAPRPGTAGTSNLFGVSGASPGAITVLVLGGLPGSFALPCPGLTLSMQDPIVLDFDGADEGGNLFVRIPVPAAVAGVSFLFQAVDFGRCAASPLLNWRF